MFILYIVVEFEKCITNINYCSIYEWRKGSEEIIRFSELPTPTRESVTQNDKYIPHIKAY